MLPNKMKISESATHCLRRLQSNTGLTVNIGARLAFFVSIEQGFTFDVQQRAMEFGGRELDKFTWLGEHSLVVEFLLGEKYPGLNRRDTHHAWACHVADGATKLDQRNSIMGLIDNL
ncbi:DNA sulfur modification protein DndE [Halieaceae bacterium IMCC14734]|uniref:DNA sulfur modification protein DndE n=1 Tax=Candidatus Litorirhabdus singularis TaxID=2518993 RepID=A0ABT3TKV4_9GAMM|nr:DNA sulfur modification protein DndE [Candidatus Litorirhabdus singularis]MCX2982875.1 DNA sulfur modification protein DndE [Candidatus Litorirhabdus singularis]